MEQVRNLAAFDLFTLHARSFNGASTQTTYITRCQLLQTQNFSYVTLKGSLARLLIDATHIKARKGGPCVGPSPGDRGKNGSKLTVLSDEESVPLCVIFSVGNVSDTIQITPYFADGAQAIL